MATAYLAPGVYVEEVPSAQQPIAGVGTNTVGFIGIVPDIITCPVLLTDAEYQKAVQNATDAQADLAKQRDEAQQAVGPLNTALADARTKQQAADAKQQAADAKLSQAANDLSNLPKDAADADKTQAKNAEKAANPANAANAELTAAVAAVKAAEEALSKKTQERDTCAAKLSAARRDAQGGVQNYRLVEFTVKAPVGDAKLCTSFAEYVQRFGPDEPVDPKDAGAVPAVSFSADDEGHPGAARQSGHRALSHALYAFFNGGGTRAFVARVTEANLNGDLDRALRDFESIDAISLVAAPGVGSTKDDLPNVWGKLIAHCEQTGDRFAILDCPESMESTDDPGMLDVARLDIGSPDSILPPHSKNAAFYIPYLEVVDPAKALQDKNRSRDVAAKQAGRVYVPPSGHVAAVYARIDEQRGVHKAPANAPVRGALDVKYYVGKSKQALLNPQGVNCIRNVNGDIVVWGARTIGGDVNGEWKYINVRRLFLFLAESIDEGTQWAVFEPNDQVLWGKLRRNVSAFLTNVWRSGALFGQTPADAFYVKCDGETNPPEVRDVGQVVTEIGVAIVRPAEFVIFRITQSLGRVDKG